MDPQLDNLVTAKDGRSIDENNDPLTGLPFLTGSPRLAVDLAWAANVLDWDT